MSAFLPLAMMLGVFGLAIPTAYLAYRAKARHRETVRKATTRDYIKTGCVLLCIAVVWKAYSFAADSGRKAMLREQFVIPDAVELTEFEFEKSGKYKGLHRTRATYRFTDRQFAAYRAKLDDPAIWYPKAFEHARRTMTGTFTFEARQWSDPPSSPGGEITQAEWIGPEFTWLHKIWRERAKATVRNGRVMCYVFQDVLNNPPSLWREEAYKVSACSQLVKSKRIQTAVMAILDFDEKTLSILID